jgi:hypothetical protein
MPDVVLASWTVLLLLGVLHGINPGMGWLFAVALGLQEEDGRAVWRALLPLAAGHALAVAGAVALALAAGLVLPEESVRWIVAGALFGMGVFHLARHRHPGRFGMRVGARDLVVWSFLMATAHGAGLMAVPFVPDAAPAGMAVHASAPEHPAAHAASPAKAPGHGAHAAPGGGAMLGLLAALVHTLGYLLATGAVAAVVYHRLRLRLLRRAWVNLDVVWAGALIATAVLIPLV